MIRKGLFLLCLHFKDFSAFQIWTLLSCAATWHTWTLKLKLSAAAEKVFHREECTITAARVLNTVLSVLKLSINETDTEITHSSLFRMMAPEGIGGPQRFLLLAPRGSTAAGYKESCMYIRNETKMSSAARTIPKSHNDCTKSDHTCANVTHGLKLR